MARFVVKCPKCEHKESVISTSMTAEMPPCPRCEDFVRMADVTPVGNQQTVISSGRPIIPQINENEKQKEQPKDRPAPPTPKRRDMRDFGPEPRA